MFQNILFFDFSVVPEAFKAGWAIQNEGQRPESLQVVCRHQFKRALIQGAVCGLIAAFATVVILFPERARNVFDTVLMFLAMMLVFITYFVGTARDTSEFYDGWRFIRLYKDACRLLYQEFGYKGDMSTDGICAFVEISLAALRQDPTKKILYEKAVSVLHKFDFTNWLNEGLAQKRGY